MISIAIGLSLLLVGLYLLGPLMKGLRRTEGRRRVDPNFFKAAPIEKLEPPALSSWSARARDPQVESDGLDFPQSPSLEADFSPTGLSGAPPPPSAPSSFEELPPARGIGLPVREDEPEDDEDLPKQGTLGF